MSRNGYRAQRAPATARIRYGIKPGAELWKYDGYKLDEAGKMTDQLDQESI